MADADTGGDARTFWQQIPTIWKIIGVLAAVASSGAAAFKTYDDIVENIETLDRRVTNVETAKLEQSDLVRFVDTERLQRAICVQTARSEKHDFMAREKAYEELIQAMRLAENAFAGRPLTEPEERQLLSIIELRSGFEAKKRDVEREIDAREQRINNPENC